MTLPGTASGDGSEKDPDVKELTSPDVVVGPLLSPAGRKAVAIVTRVIYNGNIVNVIVYLAPPGAAIAHKVALGNISRWEWERF